MTFRTLSKVLAAPVLCALSFASPAPQSFREAETAPPQADRPDDEQVLGRAARLLMARGYEDEARRLAEIVTELAERRESRGDRADEVEAAARALGRPDFDDRETRIRILELTSAGLAAEERGPAAEAIAWFAAVGRSQLEESGEPMPALPDSLEEREGPIMETLVGMIEEGARMQRRAGRKRLARLQAGLARFYRERDGLGPAPDARPERRGRDPRARDLTYIEGRAPVLALAREAYETEGLGMDPAALERARAWMGWMADHAALRVARNAGRDGEREASPMPTGGIGGMDDLIDMVRTAGEIHAKTGSPRKAKRCIDLADYYVKRQSGEAPDNSRENAIAPASPRERGADVESAESVRRRAELDAQRAKLEAEIARLRAQIAETRAQLERIRAGGDR